MSKDSHKKIALVSISLAGGGAERSTALLSQMLDRNGFEVHLITLTDAIDFEYAGTLFNLGKFKTAKDTLLKRLVRFSKLKAYLRREKFNFIIDVRSRSMPRKEAYYLHYLYKNESIIYMVHSFKLDNYFPLTTGVAKKMIAKAKGIVGVSQEIAEAVNTTFDTEKCICIYNTINQSIAAQKTVLPIFVWAGRLVDNVKNVSLLLEAFAKAKKAHTKHQLHIYGEGPDKEKLQQKSRELGLSDTVIFKPFIHTIKTEMSKAKAVILSSHYEGFPSVLIESLSVGTPVISVDCKSGPKEIIKNQENGLLVKNHDADALAGAINAFVTDDELYARCKENAVASVSHLSMDVIGKQWKEYIAGL